MPYRRRFSADLQGGRQSREERAIVFVRGPGRRAICSGSGGRGRGPSRVDSFARDGLLRPRRAAVGIGGGGGGLDQRLVEGEQVLDALAVRGEGAGAVELVDGGVELAVRLDLRALRHGGRTKTATGT